MKLWHDPQHGGENTGCLGGGIVEKDWVLEITTSLTPVLGALGCEQMSARTDDVWTPYADRAIEAKQWGARFAFLHHVNAMVFPEGHELAGEPWPKFDGLSTFALASDEQGMAIARTIGRCAPEALRSTKHMHIATPHDWTKRAYSCLVHYAREHIPAVLIEYGFVTSPNDSAILRSARHRPSLCVTVAAGVGRAFEVL